MDSEYMSRKINIRIKHVPLFYSRLFLKEKKQGFLDDIYIYMYFSVVIIHLLYHNILTHAETA